MTQINVQDNSVKNGREVVAFVGSIARTDVAAKVLFSLPANCIPIAFLYTSPTASDAGTTATISAGYAGTGTEFMNAADVKTAATGRGQNVPNLPAATKLGQIQSTAVDITGIYAETGGASTTGGPWVVTLLALV